MRIQLKRVFGRLDALFANSRAFYKKTMTTLTIFQVVHNHLSPKMDSVQEANHRAG
jgi:hypothetical protein